MNKEQEDILFILNKHLSSGNEIGIFYDRHSYDVITNRNGQNPIISDIGKNNFLFFQRNHYLHYPVMTKVGSHWYYDFSEKTKNGLSLHNFYKYEDFPFLYNKKFYIVPRKYKTIYYKDSLENEEIYKEEKDCLNIVRQFKYEFTKIKEHATIYDIEKLFSFYMYGKNPFYKKSYYTYRIDGLGWHGNGRREIEKQNCNYDVEQKNEEILCIEDRYKDFDLLSLDGKERYRINDIFEENERFIGDITHMTDQYYQDKQKEILNNPNYYKASIGIHTQYSWGNSNSYYQAKYLQKKNLLPFEEYK